MCGIYGTTIGYDDYMVRAKLDVIRHRGPDFSAFENAGPVILGHNRLAIVDLDYRSNQPFTYKHLKIVFNGEIYNYPDIRNRLLKKGYEFSTSCDTEVICAAYLHYGEECCNLFNGMFAFMIYDAVKHKLFGARDRFGKKPFYYSLHGSQFEFASQPSQIKLFRNLTIDDNAIYQYLNYGYIPEPLSIWQEVKKLPAGHSFTFDLDCRDLKTRRYWDIDYSWRNKYEESYDQAKIALEGLLFDAVDIRLQADVPVGVFLSGGIDSSLVTAIAARRGRSVNTFSVKFDEARFDESKYAQLVAQHLGTRHHVIECSFAEGINFIENFSSYYDEPFADSSAIPSLLLSKYTKKHVTVALGGDGGDEGFIGYERYTWMQNHRALFDVPYPLRRLAAALLSMSGKYKVRLMGTGISVKDIETLYARSVGGLDNSWVLEPQAGLTEDVMNILENPDKPLMERLSDLDIKTYMNGDINTKMDRASMAFALESRSPLMDYRVIEFARSLPTSYKVHRGSKKRILKDILYQYVPPEIFDRPKAGFAVPLEEWFRNELKGYVLDNLSDARLKEIPGIEINRTKHIINEHLSGQWNRSPQIWKLLVLSQWLRQPEIVPQACA